MSVLRHNLESTAAFLLFLIVYFATVLYEVAGLDCLSASERCEPGFFLGLAYLLIFGLVALLAHVLAFAWMRAKFPEQRFRFVLMLQIVVALASAWVSVQGPPVTFLAPFPLTLGVYWLAHLLSTADVRRPRGMSPSSRDADQAD